MGKINVLSSKIFNRIAAGEVVERPSSVVKELIENSIDAGADKIEISIENGGISEIKVVDNGAGIMREDLYKAILPHATSKISKVSDLENISSFGFRGEALSSIASVSKLTIVSKTKEEKDASKIYVEGGEITPVETSAGTNGTEITVKNLFFNTPARAKFLKTERTEENEIFSTVSRFILGNPDLSIKLIVNGKTEIQSFGEGLESAFVCVYGAKTLSDCLPIEIDKNGLKITGYIGKTSFTKPNRSYQTVFVNERYVVNQTVLSAINNAYSSYLMKRQYAFFVLKIDMSPEIVDVNVHPNKIDVRFSNNQVIYGTLYSVISKLLDGSLGALNIETVDKPSVSLSNQKPYIKPNENVNKSSGYKYPTDDINRLVFSDIGAASVSDPSLINESKKDDKEIIDVFAENKKYLQKKEEELKAAQERFILNQQEVGKELKLIGQALNTFLIFEDGEDLFFIDQHAAHERILYDKLMEGVKNSEIITQPLLIPFVLELSAPEFEFVNSKIEYLRKIGLDIEEFGRCAFKMSSVPAIISNLNLNDFFKDLTSDINVLKDIKLENVLTEKIAQKACKSAIKAGDKLSESEINALLELLKGNLGLKCPHGRPVCIKISRTEIDKWFKRIV